MLTKMMFEPFLENESNEFLIAENKYGIVLIDVNGSINPTHIFEEAFIEYEIFNMDVDGSDDIENNLNSLNQSMYNAWPIVKKTEI